MKVALIGYGKMGKEIEKIALQRGHEIYLKIDNEEDWATKRDAMSGVDVAIEFTLPEKAISNIMRCFELNIPVVSGTTGWNDKLGDIRDYCIMNHKQMFYASNYSIGVNIFFELNKQLASLMAGFPEYEVSIEETHHIQKQDAPSGTAIVLAEQIIEYLGRKQQWTKPGSASPGELEISSVRAENVPGTHRVFYISEVDEIAIRHTAKSRKGFATGAVMAAEWLSGRVGFYGMKDFLADLQIIK